MITDIIKQIQSEKWYNVSDEVEIAKGKYKRIVNFKQFRNQVIRILKWQAKNTTST